MIENKQIYMDHSSTTPMRSEVVDAMTPYFQEIYGNASSVHHIGQSAKAALEDSREKIAGYLGASSSEIIFTSGGTESDNLAIKGTVYSQKNTSGHLITSSLEHHAVLRTVKWLGKKGYDTTILPVDNNGLVRPEELKAALREDTRLISIMLANNEIGVLQNISELSQIAADSDAVFHTDAVQAIGKVPVDVEELGVDLLSLSGHKFYGPKGVGVLYRRGGVRIEPLQHGGHHENGLRAGTENVAGIVGLAKALELAHKDMETEQERLAGLRDSLQQGILDRIENVRINGLNAPRLPHLLNVSIEGIEGESMLLLLDAKGIAISTGSACTSGTLEPSHVLTAIGVPPEESHGSLRFSFGLINKKEEIGYVLNSLCEVVARLRDMSPTYQK